MDLTTLRCAIEELNAKLRPIADKPVAFGPDLLRRVAALPKPLDEAGVRSQAEETLLAAVEAYLRGSAEERQQIRDVVRDNRAFTWAAALPFPPDSRDHLRKHLAHFSIVDPHPDDRDAILWLGDLRRSPFYGSVAPEIAAISTPATAKRLSGR
jgi:hypothetical protein